VYVVNRTGVLAAVAAAIASAETNIDHVSIDEQDSDTAVLTFELRVRDRRHLARLVRIIRRMPDVTRVTRTIAAHARDHVDLQNEADIDADMDNDADPDVGQT
jgi:acetolactate synthase small subunit